MKNSKRIQKIIDNYIEIESLVEYYAGNDKRYKQILQEFKQLIIEVCEEQKIHDIRLAKKLKASWGRVDSNNK